MVFLFQEGGTKRLKYITYGQSLCLMHNVGKVPKFKMHKAGKVTTSKLHNIYGKLASEAESHYEICCSFPQNVRTLHALESSIFIRFLFRRLRSSDLEFRTTLS